MWSYLTRSFINPLPGYVENKAGDAENGLRSTNDLSARAFRSHCGVRERGDLCESVAGARDSSRDEGHSRLSMHWLLCLPPVMH